MIGIALVVDDVRKGFKLAFRYPVVPKGSLCSRTMQFHEIESGLFAKLFRPKSVLCNQTFELIIDGLHFVSYPVLVNRNEHKSKDTTMFNVVIALDEQHSTGSTSKIDAFRDITSQIVNAMLHEEMRTGFVSHEVRILLNADDELSQADKNTTTTSSNDWDPNRTLAARQTLIDVALERSRLANSLKDIYHGLKESGTVHVVMNDWVKLSLTIHRCFESCSIKSFRPYHTLLLLRDEERVLESLPFDCSPQLERLIKASNPLRSFQELHLELGISLKQLYRLAAHLVYWGVARIITTVTKYSIYQVHPSANIDPNSTLSVEFRRKFPPNELHQVLSTFSATRRLGEYLKKLNSVAQTEFLYIIVSHTYICSETVSNIRRCGCCVMISSSNCIDTYTC